ncbi:MAG: hypothetical protein K1X79_08885 [Oligoflexia bacterium]|nr:hypothetical protein [Oligoflexia bacterium]
MPNNPRHRDIALAITLLIVSLSSSVLAYAGILRIERPEFVFLSGLSLGEQSANIRQSEKCIGSLKTTIAHDSTYQLHASGDLRGSYGGKVANAAIAVHGFFNPLGQLSDATITLTGPESKIEIYARETNPIKIRIQVNVRNHVFEQKLDIPGPLVIKKSGPHFQLEYAHLPSSQHSLLRTISSALPSEVSFHILAEPGVTCDNTEALELSPIVTSLRSLLLPFSSFIPGIEELSK